MARRALAVFLLTAGPACAQSKAAPAQGCANPDALGVSRVMSLDTKGGLHVGLKSYPQTLPLRDKEVVLTFDDGPLPGPTDKVLDALKAQCAKATFFLIGRNAEANPTLARREFAEGHTVGHHSWSHPWRTLRGISAEAAVEEMRRGVAADQKAATGADWTGGRPLAPFFRFPGFADTPAALAWLDQHDIAAFGADVWASDWNLQTPQAQLALVMQRLERARGGIVLFHDTRPQTASMIPEFLARLKQGGYRIVHIVPGASSGEAMKRAPAGWTSETEAILTHMMPRLLAPATGPASTTRENGR